MQHQDDTTPHQQPGRSGDAAILDLFKQMVSNREKWAEIGRTAPDDDPVYLALADADDDFTESIARTPASGPVGMSIKAYIAYQGAHSWPAGNINGILLPEGIAEAVGQDGRLAAGMAFDALRLFPALDALRTRGAPAFRDALDAAQAAEGGTTIPELSMTFAQALEKWREMGRAEREADDQAGDAINLERGKLAAAILAAEPVTTADALALLELLADPETGLAAGDGPNDAPAIQRALAILSRTPAGLNFGELSPAVVTAYREWRRADEVRAALSRLDDDAAEGDEADALAWFGEAVSQLQYRLWGKFHDTPSPTMAGRLFKVRVILDEEGGAFDTIRTDAGETLTEIVRTVPPPPDLDAPEAPSTDDERRAFLTARPGDVVNTSPADLLRLFTPEQGAEVFALLASYVQAKASALDVLPLVLESLAAYGHFASEVGTLDREEGYIAGVVLTDNERTYLAQHGYLPEPTVKRLDDAAELRKAERGADERRQKEQLEADERAKRGPPLAEQLCPLMPSSTDEARKAAAGAIYSAEFAAVSRRSMLEDLRNLQQSEAEALRNLDFPSIGRRFAPGTQDEIRRGLDEVLGQQAQSDDRLTATGVAATTFEAAFPPEQLQSVREGIDGHLKCVSVHARASVAMLKWNDRELELRIRDDRKGAFVILTEGVGRALDSLRAIDELLQTAAVRLCSVFARIDPESAAAAFDQPKGTDGFASAIAAFQGAAPSSLCIPDTPTDAMLEAGAAAGGINPEQARAIYAAMAGAYRQEAA